MSFNYLPTPLYIGIALFFSVLLISYAIKLSTSENYRLPALGYVLLGLSGLCVVIAKTIEEYINSFKEFIWVIDTMMGLFLLTGFIIIAICAWKKSNAEPPERKMLMFSFGAIIVGFIIITVVISIFVFKN